MAPVISVDAHVGRRLSQARTECGLELEQGAGLLGLAADDLAEIEAGRVRATASFLFEACKAYGCSVSYLFALHGEGEDPLQRQTVRGAC